MATTPPRPDPSSPTSIASASFTSVRKGYDPAEVRSFLQSVSRELAGARDELARVTQELDAARSGGAPVLDEARAEALLGEEAARVLRTAREGAAAVQARAEEGAARLLREAQDDASRLRHEAELEGVQARQAAADDAAAERESATAAAARLRADAAAESERIRAEAHAQAEAEVAAAKQEAREMLAETRAIRERMLSDLARRRDAARQQLERLQGARDRIVGAFAAARQSLDDAVAVVDDAFVVDEPAPTMPADDTPADDTPDTRSDAVSTGPDRLESRQNVGEVEGDAEVVSIVVGEAPTPTTAEEGAVDDLFARLRAASTDGVAAQVLDPAAATAPGAVTAEDAAAEEPAADDAGTDGAVTDDEADPFAARAAVIDPIGAALARSLKRVLSDEQNDVLDRLRRHTRGTTLDTLVGTADEQSARYGDTAREHLEQAAAAGAALVGGVPGEPVAVDLARVADEVVAPLRERLQRGLDQAQGDTVEAASVLRATYREWKTQRLDALAADLAYEAAGFGAYASLPEGTPTCWLVEPGGTPCPDADDNALAGVVGAGEPFPTGHRYPPAHAGCRCLLTRHDG